MSNYLFHMSQLQSIINSDMIEGIKGFPIPCFGPFLPLHAQIFPLLNFSLCQLANQKLYQICVTNIELPFPYVPTTIYYQL